MRNTLIIANALSLVAAIAMNFLSVSSDWFALSVGEVSDKYSNLFTPAGYAFSIWSLIYLSLIAFCIYQWIRRDDEAVGRFVDRTGWWFVIANLATCVWIVVWLSDNIATSVPLMVITFVALLIVFLRNYIALTDPPTKYLAFLWWPIILYFGWITTALIANVSVYLTSIGWRDTMNEEAWTIGMLIVAALVYILMVIYRHVRLYGLVGVWALLAIYAARSAEGYTAIANTALIGAILLLIVIGLHAYRYRKTLPFVGRPSD